MRGKPGEIYRPANGTEGMDFEERFCERCWRDRRYRATGDGSGCSILSRVFTMDPREKGYPKEWVYDADGLPTCTAFAEQRSRSRSAKRPPPDQRDLFAGDAA